MPAGRPPTWTDPEAFDKAVDAYFDNKEEAHTWTGLAMHMGFVSRDSLRDYGLKEEFSASVKKALLKIENKYEKAISNNNPTGAIFALKNFGWADKKEIDHTTKGDKIEVAPTINVYNQAPPIAESEDQIQ
jgi:hypothetical protein